MSCRNVSDLAKSEADLNSYLLDDQHALVVELVVGMMNWDARMSESEDLCALGQLGCRRPMEAAAPRQLCPDPGYCPTRESRCPRLREEPVSTSLNATKKRIDALGVIIKLTGLSDSSSTAEIIVTSSSLSVSVPRSGRQRSAEGFATKGRSQLTTM